MLTDTFQTAIELTLRIVMIVAVIAIVGAAFFFFSKFAKADAQSSKSEYLQTMFAHIGETIESVVHHTNQTYVNELKNSNRFDIDAQRCALNISQATALNMLNAEAISLIGQTHGDVQKWISTQIESVVMEQGLAKTVGKP